MDVGYNRELFRQDRNVVKLVRRKSCPGSGYFIEASINATHPLLKEFGSWNGGLANRTELMAVQFSQLVFSEFDADAGVPQASFSLVSFSNVFRFEFSDLCFPPRASNVA